MKAAASGWRSPSALSNVMVAASVLESTVGTGTIFFFTLIRREEPRFMTPRLDSAGQDNPVDVDLIRDTFESEPVPARRHRLGDGAEAVEFSCIDVHAMTRPCLRISCCSISTCRR